MLKYMQKVRGSKNKGTCSIGPTKPHLGPDVGKMGQKFAARPHQELIPRVYGARAVKQDDAIVLNC